MKVSLQNPIEYSWPIVDFKECDDAMIKLKNLLLKLGYERNKKCKRTLVDKHIVLGVNEVTKGLEKGEIHLVIASKEKNPTSVFMTQHLIEMCHIKNITAIQLPLLLDNVMIKLNYQSCLALGFKSSSCTDIQEFCSYVKSIVSSSNPIQHPSKKQENFLRFDNSISFSPAKPATQFVSPLTPSAKSNPIYVAPQPFKKCNVILGLQPPGSIDVEYSNHLDKNLFDALFEPRRRLLADQSRLKDKKICVTRPNPEKVQEKAQKRTYKANRKKQANTAKKARCSISSPKQSNNDDIWKRLLNIC